MLRHSGKMLVQEVLEAAIVRADDELPCPEVRPPMANGMYEVDEFALVRRQLGVLRGTRTTEEHDRSGPLMKHHAKTHAGGVAVDDERLVEVRQLEGRHRGECMFERVKP
jgi:hypothetical protein